METQPPLLTTVPVPTRNGWTSSTFWVNVLTAAAEGAQMLSGTNLIPPQYLLIANAVINLGLRVFKTNSPVTFTGQKLEFLTVERSVAREMAKGPTAPSDIHTA